MMERKYPQRTCIGCRLTKDKKALIRIVRTPEGEILTDESGKMNGRGAYICPDPACLQKALSGKSLAKSLHAEISPEVRDRLIKEMEKFVRE